MAIFLRMSAITLKNLPESLHAQLKIRARRNHRSLNGEVIAVLHAAVLSEEMTQNGQILTPSIPTYHGGTEIPPDFDLEAAMRAERSANDDAIAARLFSIQRPSTQPTP